MKIKTILSRLALLTLLVSLFLPVIALAQDRPLECCYMRKEVKVNSVTCRRNRWVGPDGGYCPDGEDLIETNLWGLCCLVNALYTITDWLFFILVAFSSVMVVLGAFVIVTATGDPSKVSSGQKYITYSMLGLMIALLSKAIPALVKALI